MALTLGTTPTTNGAAKNGSVGVADIEMALLLEGVYRLTGLEFRGYSPALLKRRIADRVRAENRETISGLIELSLHDHDALERLVYGLSVHPTGVFRDAHFYEVIRRNVVPLLRTYPFVRVWHAGCGTGEETYTLAIILKEAGIFDRCKIYATDLSEIAIRSAKEGRYPLAAVQAAADAYTESGGSEELAAYYSAQGESAQFRDDLSKNIIFAQHNLVSDGSFNEFHLIVARNLLTNYNKTLQSRVHSLFLESLIRLGYLALGNKDSIKYSPHERAYEEIDAEEHVYRRAR